MNEHKPIYIFCALEFIRNFINDKLQIIAMRLDNTLYKYAEETKLPKNVLEYEQEFSLPEKIFNIASGCPICNSNIKGNRNMGFHCEDCNLIFTENNLINTKKIINTKKNN